MCVCTHMCVCVCVFPFLSTPSAYGSSWGQGWNLSHSCDLDHSYGNSPILNPLSQLGIDQSFHRDKQGH